MSAQDKLILYTNHRCPWAHRAHIVLEELKIPFEEVIIDLDTPRTAEYLQINPRGLVPALSYNGEILIESGIVAQFLVDRYPSHLVPASNELGGALRRARIGLFADAFNSKFQSQLYGLYSAKTEEEREAAVEKAVAGLVKEVEPQLTDASPYFGGSDKITFAEVLTASFAIRLLSFIRADLYPRTLRIEIEEKAPNFWKWAKTVSAHPSVTSIYDETDIIESAKKRIAKLRASA